MAAPSFLLRSLVLPAYALSASCVVVACASEAAPGSPTAVRVDGGGVDDAPPATAPPASSAPPAEPSDASTAPACGGVGVPSFIDWTHLKNPIFSRPDRMIKDESVLYRDGFFYVFGSQGTEDGTPAPAIWKTRDLKTYEELPAPLGRTDSPDVSEIDGSFHMVFQAAPEGANADFRRIFHATSVDLASWTTPTEIAPSLDPTHSVIDGTIARESGRWFFGFKDRSDQNFYVAESATDALDGNVSGRMLASAGGAWAENFQFVKIDGAWRMIATGHNPNGPTCLNFQYACDHEPFLYRMDGAGTDLADWTKWIDKTHLDVPKESWNSTMHANSGFLADWRAHDGYFYLFYAGSDDLWSFNQRTHGQIGVVRSCDLVHWKLPGQP